MRLLKCEYQQLALLKNIAELHTHTVPNKTRISHYNDVTWTLRSLKSPAIRLFVKQRMRSHIKKNRRSPQY